MRLLLDTHVWLWLQAAPERLGDTLGLVEDPSNEILLSAASSWEIAIKWTLGRIGLPEPPETYIPERMATNGVEGLPIRHDHAWIAASLPPHHRDPFDRMLVAQAITEGAALATADPALAPYEVELVWTGRH